MTFEQLLYAEVLSHQTSMQAAADILHITKSGLSFAISQLEEELGVKIFERTNKGTVLTAEGLQTLSAITNVLRAKNDLFDTITILKSQNQMKTIKLAYSNNVPDAFLNVYLNNFQKKYPNIRVDLICDHRDVILNKIRSKEIDMGFVALPQELGDLGQELNFEPVCHTKIELICSKNHPIVNKDKITFDDIKELKFSMFHDESYDYVLNQMQYMCGPLSVVFKTDDCNAMKKALNELETVSIIRAADRKLYKSDWLADIHHISLGHLVDDNSILAWIYNTHRNFSNETQELVSFITEQMKTDTE